MTDVVSGSNLIAKSTTERFDFEINVQDQRLLPIKGQVFRQKSFFAFLLYSYVVEFPAFFVLSSSFFARFE